ncbi:amino acid oxidase [Lasiosphaeria ovina]|uniref:Amino acid oxidase n=1 Tax=Lasiosphaeria ovina TaxID=92902 RepID=A0AAE0NLF3_9PEZI|nr:amino acid oxidase [Lasiosphaeria ovina]
MAKHIVVIGAGVIGLSAAIALEEAGYDVTIVARDFPGPAETFDGLQHINFSSPWAGAHNRWVPPLPSGEGLREHRFALTTFARMRALASAATEPTAHGITFMKGIEYVDAGAAVLADVYGPLTEARAQSADFAMPGFRLLGADDFPDARVAWGCEYDTWCVNPMVYCAFLLRRFVFRGGRVARRELRAVAEVFALPAVDAQVRRGGVVDAVVNASGVGFGGPEDGVFPTRGQTCLVANTCDATVTRQHADGSWTFCVPRGFEGGTIVGGTKEPDSWDLLPSLAVRERLLHSMAATYPPILDGAAGGGFTVIRDVVGRRPTRKAGLRLEGELLPGAAAAGGDGFVMHAYGLGGRGYELSWGVAEGVVTGVREYLEARASSTA